MTRYFVPFVFVVTLLPSYAAEKPRVYITESQAAQASGDAKAGEIQGSLSFTGGSSPQNIEVMKTFAERCPGVVVTSNREKADFTVRLDHEPASPATPFIKGNKVAVFDRNGDLLHSASTRLLPSAVKGACAAMTGHK
ncbi:MAG: hypothetical protein ABI823_02825 [Bryobacteraceae bacterium]